MTVTWLKEKARSAKYAVTRKSEAEVAFLECTNEEKWGPSNTAMQVVVRFSRNYQDWSALKALYLDLFDKFQKKKVRCIKKGLLLMEYIINNGEETMRSEMQVFQGTLQSLTYLQQHQTGEKAAIEAVIRKKAQDILDLMSDTDLYRMERSKARKLKESLSSVTNDGFGGPVSQSTYSSGYQQSSYAGNSGGFNDGHDSAPQRRVEAQPPVKDDEYYSDEEPAPKPKPAPKGRAGQGQAAPQQQFDPFAAQQTTQARPNPFAGQQQQQQQQFNPFAGQQAAPQQPNMFAGQQQQQRPNPFGGQQAPQQQQFNPFAGQQAPQQQQQAANMDDLLGFSAPVQQAPVQQQQQQQPQGFDDLLFGAPSQPVRQAPQQQQPAANANFLDLSVVPSQPAGAPMGGQHPAAQKPSGSAMFQEFGDLANLNFNKQENKTYGAAGFQQRGGNPTQQQQGWP